MRKRRLRLLVRYLFPTLEYLRRTPRGAKSLGSQLEKKENPCNLSSLANLPLVLFMLSTLLPPRQTQNTADPGEKMK